ncbi:hypothetical protein [Microcoleus sp. B3-A4]|uniref:hypothetical protein n=1 Tax=Microcoleus sp. B3-A4 TaxID=2818653 RepID=UPI002FD3F9D5
MIARSTAQKPDCLKTYDRRNRTYPEKPTFYENIGVVTRKWGRKRLFTNTASTTEGLPPIVTKCNEASSNLGEPQVTSPEAPENEKKPLSAGAGTQYPPHKANLNVEQLTKQSLFPSNKPV